MTTVTGEPTARPTRSARASVHRWWRRRPIRRALVLAHRWPALILGILLVIETTSGAVLLYNGDYFRATHANLYHHSASSNPIGPDQAIAAVKAIDPGFAPIWASKDDGIWAVGNIDYQTVYTVEPGTGHVNGKTDTDGGVMGFLVNLHDCGLTCEGYPGYVAWLGDPVPTLGIRWLDEVTWSSLILGTLGLLMILLAITGLITWWPGRKRLSHGFRVRTGKGRFARDFDLHNLIGIIAVPFVLLWGVTGAAFEFPVVENVWLAITGGDQPHDEDFSITANPHAKGAAMITTEQATAVALDQVPGTATFIGRPYQGADYFEIDIASGYGAADYRAIYNGDAYVLVDAYDAAHSKVIDEGSGPAANRFYDKYLEPSHFGWNVNGWWRLIWLAMGLAPLGLMVTGISTWLYRRGTKRRRRTTVIRA